MLIYLNAYNDVSKCFLSACLNGFKCYKSLGLLVNSINDDRKCYRLNREQFNFIFRPSRTNKVTNIACINITSTCTRICMLTYLHLVS